MKYIWQSKEWPNFHWDWDRITPQLGACRKAQGLVQGKLALLGLSEKNTSWGQALVEESLQTSAIEGEKIDVDALRSSVERHLGIKLGGKNTQDRRADGLVEMLLDTSLNINNRLDAKRLWGWQAGLFPTGYSGISKITAGKWRSKPVYVVSGPIGKEKIHYTAPAATVVPSEMKKFFVWWEASRGPLDGVVRAGVAHFHFVMIHPFEDGNGRVARALTDLALAQDEGGGQRCYSLSRAIIQDRKGYYAVLERAGKNGADITEWLLWYLETLKRALLEGEQQLEMVVGKIRFWQEHEKVDLNSRQRKVINKMLDAEPAGFIGGLTTKKYQSIARTSRATAFREIADMQSKGLLIVSKKGGRSTSYRIKK